MTGALITGALITGALIASPAQAEATRYTATLERSRLFVMVFKDPDALGAKLSHDHVVRAQRFQGEVQWDPAAPQRCEVDISVPVAALDPDPPALRKRVGLKRMLTPSDRAQVKENLLAKDQLWGERYPTIRFKAARCIPKAGAYEVVGTLTLRGQERAVKARMTIGVEPKSGELSASGSLSIRHTWFGFEPYSALGGALKNQDEMRLVIVLRASPATP